ncbi:hypothetical protein OSB04_000869 [Centaurea solstitialis]|uniref:Fe2OG dioxygenase domain-containing protein n=1 Tax=Centaurea solstitialis TaxID=347529 RepID=A0AA38TXE2_9ASTR|nr:hypothetical protein OSB04_000869 [Centaurea solstitialis]
MAQPGYLNDSSSTDTDEDWEQDAQIFAHLVQQANASSSIRRSKAPNIDRGRVEANARLMADYFDDNPMYPEKTFKRRFRMSRNLFTRIVYDLYTLYPYFQQQYDATGLPGLSPYQKCTAAIRQLAYGITGDAWDDYVRMGESTARKCLNHFVEGIIQMYGKVYLRKPTYEDIQQLYAAHDDRHGFPGMLGSLDCMHWEWAMCPVAWQGQYHRGDKPHPSIILEAAASQDTWIWHAFFGCPGAMNDLNVLNHSPIFEDVYNGIAPDRTFQVNGATYKHGYYLGDGIYHEWATFVKAFSYPEDDKRIKFKGAQEAARKDIERAFGILRKRWNIIKQPSRFMEIPTMRKVMYACIILHNMILENKNKAICVVPNDIPDPPNPQLTEEQLPIINMEYLSSIDSKDSELEKLHLACKDWGFFQLINHGVSCSLLERVKQETQEFFDMPLKEKKKYWQPDGDLEGFGQAFVMSDEQKLDWADIFYLVTLPTGLRKPHLFPKLPLPFRDTLQEYSIEVKKAALKTLVFIAKALNMEVEEMKVLFDNGMQAMRMNYYPPCPQPEQVIGLTPHSDATGITFLLQLNQVEGLEIKKDGMWIPIKSHHDAFIVNIGDILESVTNGVYKSIEHRATVNSEKKRLSIATFLSPDVDGDFGPAPSLVTPDTPARFTRVSVLDFLKNLFSTELKGKTIIDQYHHGSKGNIPWGSLPFPSVQELVKESLTEVPPRYIRPNQEAPVISSFSQVPIINMEYLSSTDSKDSELEKLHLAYRDWGFFQLINHGVSCSLLEKVKQETQELFDMPLKEKKKYWQQAGDLEGFGQAFVVSHEQKLDWADMLEFRC